MNALVPQSPGRPGLLYRANDAHMWKGSVYSVFVQLRRAEHKYVGEYELTRARSLSTAEYKSWTPQVYKAHSFY